MSVANYAPSQPNASFEENFGEHTIKINGKFIDKVWCDQTDYGMALIFITAIPKKYGCRWGPTITWKPASGSGMDKQLDMKKSEAVIRSSEGTTSELALLDAIKYAITDCAKSWQDITGINYPPSLIIAHSDDYLQRYIGDGKFAELAHEEKKKGNATGARVCKEIDTLLFGMNNFELRLWKCDEGQGSVFGNKALELLDRSPPAEMGPRKH